MSPFLQYPHHFFSHCFHFDLPGISHIFSDIGKIVKQLKTCFISKRGKFVSRITKEPIKDLLKIILQKMELVNYIKTLVPVAEIPKMTQIKLNIVQSSAPQTHNQLNIPTIQTQTQPSPMRLNIQRPNQTQPPIVQNTNQTQPSPIVQNSNQTQPSPMRLNIQRPNQTQPSPIKLNIPTIQNQTLVIPTTQVSANQNQVSMI